MEKIIVYTDGGSRGNPGPAGVGVVIKNAKSKNQNDKEKCQNIEISKYIGTKTNNQAEYTAVVEALEWLIAYHKEHMAESDIDIEFNLDSQLVVEQLNGNYKMKNEGLMPLYNKARELVMELGGRVSFTHILRSKNEEADILVNKAIDEKL